MLKKLFVGTFVVSILFFLSGCFQSGPKTLTTPTNVSLSDTYVITFDEVEKASGYQAKLVFGTSFLFAVTSGEDISSRFTAPGEYLIAVKAVGDDEKYKDSEYSQPIPITVEYPDVIISQTSVVPSVTEGATVFDYKTLFTITVDGVNVLVTDAMITQNVNLNVPGTYAVTCTHEQNGKTGTKTIDFVVLESKVDDFLASLTILSVATSYQLTYLSVIDTSVEEVSILADYVNGVRQYIFEDETSIYLLLDSDEYVYYNQTYSIWDSTPLDSSNVTNLYGYDLSYNVNISALKAITEIEYNATDDIYIINSAEIAEAVFGLAGLTTIEATVIGNNLYSLVGKGQQKTITVTFTKYNNVTIATPAVEGFESLIPAFTYESDKEGDTSLATFVSALSYDYANGNFGLAFDVQYMSFLDKEIYNFGQFMYCELGSKLFYYEEYDDVNFGSSVFVYLPEIDAYVEYYITSSGEMYPFPLSNAGANEYFFDLDLATVASELSTMVEAKDGFFVPIDDWDYTIFAYLFGDVRSSDEDIVTVNYLKIRVEEGKLVGIYAQVVVDSAEYGREVYTVAVSYGAYEEVDLVDFLGTDLDLFPNELGFIDAEVNSKTIELTITDGSLAEVYTIVSNAGSAIIKAPDGKLYYVYQEPGYIAFEIYYVNDSGLWAQSEIYMNANGEWVYDIAFPFPSVVLTYWVYDEEGYIIDMPFILEETSDPLEFNLTGEYVKYAFYDYFYGYIYYNGEHILIDYNSVVSGTVRFNSDELIDSIVFEYSHNGKVLSFIIELSDGYDFRFPEAGAKAGLDDTEKALIDAINALDFSNYTLAYYIDGYYFSYEEYGISASVVEYYYESDYGYMQAFIEYDEEGFIINAVDGSGNPLSNDDLIYILDYMNPKTLGFISSDMFDNVRYDDGVPAFNVKDEYMDLVVNALFYDYGYTNWDFYFLEMIVDGGDIIFVGYTFDYDYIEVSFTSFGSTAPIVPVPFELSSVLIKYENIVLDFYLEDATETPIGEGLIITHTIDLSAISADDFELSPYGYYIGYEEVAAVMFDIICDTLVATSEYASYQLELDSYWVVLLIADGVLEGIVFVGEIYYIDILLELA